MTNKTRLRIGGWMVAAIVVCATGPRLGAEDKPADGRYRDPQGRFSFDLPKDWKISTDSGLTSAQGPSVDDIRPSLFVSDDISFETLEDYAKDLVSTEKQILLDFKLIKQEPFETTGHLKGLRIITTSGYSGVVERHRIYLFSDGKKSPTMYAIACIAQGSKPGIEKFDSVFDDCLKTFHFDKQSPPAP